MTRVTKSAVKEIVEAAFPDYRGRKFWVRAFKPMSLVSAWEGGCKSDFVVLDLITLRRAEIPSNGGLGQEQLKAETLPENLVIVEELIVNGRACSITVYANQANLAKLLSYPAEVK